MNTWYIRVTSNGKIITFIFEVGTSASATRARKLGSNCRQLREEVAIARSSSIRSNKENKKGSAPVFWSQSNEVQQRYMLSHRPITCASQSSSDARKCVGVGMQ